MMMKPGPRYARMTAEARRQNLIEAALTSLGRYGIQGFTIDRISTEAGVSRGLITHHFKSKDGLLAAVYETMIGTLIADIEATADVPEQSPEDHIRAIVDSVFGLQILNRESLKIWLALWGEIANNPELLRAHRAQYARYCGGVEAAIAGIARKRGLNVDTRALAVMFVALVDGLWLEWCIDPGILSVHQAREACFRLLTPVLGEI